MGEAPAFVAENVIVDFPSGFDLKPKGNSMVDLKFKGNKTSIDIGSKTYVIGGGADHELKSTIGVQIYDKSSGKWINPTVLGTNPMAPEGFSAVLLRDDRILVVTRNSPIGDCFWFLEVNTPFVRQQANNFGTEVVAWSKGVIGDAEKPVVISGPSGVGKGTLISKLMEEFPSLFGFSVSHTTRAPREKEQNGVHYHFTERSKIEKEIRDGKFIEFAHVHGNVYGTSVEAVEVVADSGKRCILDIDVQGARSVRASSLEAIFIFISPPSYEKLEQRLRARWAMPSYAVLYYTILGGSLTDVKIANFSNRGTETEEQIQKRLRNAWTEIEQANSPGLFDHVLVNDDLEACYKSLKVILVPRISL